MTLRENIDWVGYVDWTVRDFHGYSTDRGATYNAYLVRDKKTALIDTVKAPYADVLLRNIAEKTDPASVDYIVCNHGEPDHSSALPAMVKALPNATVLCSPKAMDSLGRYFDMSDWRVETVKTGDSVSLGARTLAFVETPMVHWPDSMFTYVPEEKLLFSMDAFGQHFSSSNRFDDENPLTTIMEEARIYYANIVTPYSKRVSQTLEAAGGLDIEMIAPSHGVIWRSHIPEILKAYRNWSTCKPKAKVVVLYDTMWDSTGAMARAMLAGASVPGVEAKLYHIRTSNLTALATEMLDAAAVAVGSSTLNRDMLPMVAATLTYFRGLSFPDRKALAFGSYGWGKGGAEAIDEFLKSMKWDVVGEPIRARYRPDAACLEQCREAGARLAALAREAGASSGYEPLCTD